MLLFKVFVFIYFLSRCEDVPGALGSDFGECSGNVGIRFVYLIFEIRQVRSYFGVFFFMCLTMKFNGMCEPTQSWSDRDKRGLLGE